MSQQTIPAPLSHLLFLLLIVFTCSPSFSQIEAEQGYWDTRFGTASWQVRGLLTDSDGRLIVYAGQQMMSMLVPLFPSVARWDGRSWEALETNGANITVMVQHDGTICGAGSFTTIGGVPASRIAQYKNGQWSPLAEGIDGVPSSLVVFGSDLVVGGTFSQAGTVSATNVARWTGTEWQSLGDGLPDPVTVLTASSNALFAVSSPPNNLSRSIVSVWENQKWTQLGSFSNSNNVSSPVRTIAWFNDALYVGGPFEYIDGNPATNIAGWKDREWFLPGDAFLKGTVTTLFAGKSNLYLAGDISFVRDNVTNQAALLKLENNNWVPMLQEATAGKCIAERGNELFITANPTNQFLYKNCTSAIWHYDGSSWTMINNSPTFIPILFGLGFVDHNLVLCSFDASVSKPLVWDGRHYFSPALEQDSLGHSLQLLRGMTVADNVAYAPARFATTTSTIVARYSSNTWSAATGATPIDVNLIASWQGKIAIGGRFAGGSTSRGGVFVWNGSAWEQAGGDFTASLVTGGTVGYLYTLFVFKNQLFAGGAFIKIGGVPINYLAQWDGAAWQPVPGSPNYPIVAAAATVDRLYLVGGLDLSATPADCKVLSWDGLNWQQLGAATFPGGASASVPVTSIACSDNDAIAMGGSFRMLTGKPANGLAILRNGEWSVPYQIVPINYPFTPKQLLWRGHDLYAGGDAVVGGFNESWGLVIWHEPGALLETPRPSADQSKLLRFSGMVPMNFALERTSDFKSWQTVSTNALGHPGDYLLDPNPDPKLGFYRLSSRP